MTTAVHADRRTVQLRGLVHERLEHSTEPDPADALAGLVDELDADQLRDAAELGLRHVAQEIIRRERSAALNGRAAGASVYDGAAELVQAHPAVFGLRVCIGPREWRFLGDCDRDDLEHAEQDARRRGAELLARAEQYARLRGKLRGRRRVVADLGVEVVREVFAA